MKRRSGARRPFRGPRVLSLSWLACLLVTTSLASAAERHSVRAVLAGHPAVIERIAKVIRASLAPQGLDIATTVAPTIDPLDVVRIPDEPPGDAPVAYLWLDLAAKQPTLFLVEARTHLVYARRLDVHADPDHVETELIRFVVDQSLSAILIGNAPGVTSEEFRRSLAPRQAKLAPAAAPVAIAATVALPPSLAVSSSLKEPAAARLLWALAAGYSLTALDADAIAHGPELSAELQAPHFDLKLLVSQRFPLNVTRNEARLSLVSSNVRVVASARLSLDSGFALSLGIGAGLDATQVTASVEGAVPAFWVSDPLLLSQVAVQQPWGKWLLTAYGGGEWDPIDARYTIARPGAASTVWTPSRLRPRIGVSFGYAFH